MLRSGTALALRVAVGGLAGSAARPPSCVLRAQVRYSAAALDLTSFHKQPPAKLLKPTSQWRLSQLHQFFLGFKSDLGFTKQQLEAVSLLPEAKAFAACPALKGDITAKTWRLDMKGVPVDASYSKKKVNAAFVQLRTAVKRHAAGAKQARTKKRKPLLAQQLAILCGFHDCKGFEVISTRTAFKFAGKDINSSVFAVKRTGASDQLLLFWEDKLPGATTEVSNSLLHQSAAQIIGEMISVHWKNRSHGHGPLEVYAVRLIDDTAAFFRMEMSAEQIKAVCDDGVVPDPRLQVDCVPRHALIAGEEYGVSLLHPVGRDWFVRTMACIRAEMLKRESNSALPQRVGRKVTLVLDMDETLLHRIYPEPGETDLDVRYMLNGVGQGVYVKKRPYVEQFLARAVELFDVIVWTAAMQVYAEPTIDELCRLARCGNVKRMYRDSCSKGGYVKLDNGFKIGGGFVKDLSVLGKSLEDVCILDNTPSVATLQPKNLLPIESWYGDPDDTCLRDLIPHLEKLATCSSVYDVIPSMPGWHATHEYRSLGSD